MKVESIHIQSFKRFEQLEIYFKNGILDEVADKWYKAQPPEFKEMHDFVEPGDNILCLNL
ncbi:hypothetical protein [Coleofasciculus sp.]|uniref:hypothetical protein n=1 Tax=Coleofasciculus sp. TaxID=3100458 RepID=UPI003A484B50